MRENYTYEIVGFITTKRCMASFKVSQSFDSIEAAKRFKNEIEKVFPKEVRVRIFECCKEMIE